MIQRRSGVTSNPRRKKYRESIKAKGLCVDCRKPRTNYARFCDACQFKRRASNRSSSMGAGEGEYYAKPPHTTFKAGRLALLKQINERVIQRGERNGDT